MHDFLDTVDDSDYIGYNGHLMAQRPSCLGLVTAKVTEETNRKPVYIFPEYDGFFAEPI